MEMHIKQESNHNQLQILMEEVSSEDAALFNDEHEFKLSMSDTGKLSIKNEDETLKGLCSEEFLFKHLENCVVMKVDNEVENINIGTESNNIRETNDNNNPMYKCEKCGFKTLYRRSLKAHLQLHEDPNTLLWYQCSECTYKTRQRGQLNRHFLVHQNLHDRDMFICGICEYKFKQKCSLRRHIKEVHIASRIKKNPQVHVHIYHCAECSYSTARRSLLVSHLDKHKDAHDVSDLYICDICSFSTKYKRCLKAHLLTHRRCPELEIYACYICNFKTKLSYSLKRHNLSRGHLQKVGKMHEYCPRYLKVKQEKCS